MPAMLGPRTLVLVLGVGPMCALVSLQMAIVISSRVNDPRTAQQFGVLIVVPVTALVIAQVSGALWLTRNGPWRFWRSGLFVLWILLTLFSVALFEREAILTRWK